MTSELIHRTQTSQFTHRNSDSPPDSNCPPKSTNRIGYMLRHRLPFLLLGVAIAAAFFHLLPSPSTAAAPHVSLLETNLALPTRRVLMEDHTEKKGRVPIGVKGKRQKRIVVTGGAGFVGSHLVDRLMERGDSVIVVDNFFTGRKENVLHHMGNPNFELIRHDVVEPILLEVDQIYHLACPASPVHYKFNPVKTIISFLHIFLPFFSIHSFIHSCNCFFILILLEIGILDSYVVLEHKTNVVGTLNMLGLAKRVGARFLLTSTSEVYGDPLQHPQAETYWGNVNPIGNLNN